MTLANKQTNKKETDNRALIRETVIYTRTQICCVRCGACVDTSVDSECAQNRTFGGDESNTDDQIGDLRGGIWSVCLTYKTEEREKYHILAPPLHLTSTVG